MDKIPMGISQWKAYGQKYGYWDYFKLEDKIMKGTTWLQHERVKNPKRKWYQFWKPKYIWVPITNK